MFKQKNVNVSINSKCLKIKVVFEILKYIKLMKKMCEYVKKSIQVPMRKIVENENNLSYRKIMNAYALIK